ncbi:MAG: hypothetical protein ALECFALPRED_003940 [Alectoria fallacina]|uniref:Sucrose transport protein n=1 Tax=Alectoria fallacina TaxID=1903189 RepID=A0A8H3IU75_9LECA|nr:MAG: hypothetical protein ALECFALPRED_003940 [Alectoria fallacina]
MATRKLTNCTPYLLQLGLTKSRTSLVWIAGPLSGLIMQPVVGVLADNSRSKWGRRRPFMIGGALIVAVCLLVLGWTGEIVRLFVREPETVGDWEYSLLGVTAYDGLQAKSCTIALAVLSIYAVDFAINAVQSSCRSLIVDTLPIAKQQLGSAWGERYFPAFESYGAGTLDLVSIFGNILGDSQFKQLTVIAAVGFLIAIGITSWAVEERVLISARDDGAKAGAVKMISKILKTTMHLPDRIQAICWVQFWAWIGWFPFLFYSTTWVGEVYFRYHPETNASASKDALGDIGRVGSLSLVVFSLITFVASILLPFVVQSPDMSRSRPFTPRPPAFLGPFAPLVTALDKRKPDLPTAWQFSHIIFAGAMCMAPFVRSLQMATVIVSICGIPWALACWAPFAFMGVEINRLTTPSTMLANGSSYRRLSNSNDDFSSPAPSPTFLRLHHLDRDDDSSSGDSSTGETAGIYLGILNLFTTLPQFVGTFISMIVFSILEPGKSPELHEDSGEEDVAKAADGPNAIAVCLFIGALSAVGAAYATTRMKAGSK